MSFETVLVANRGEISLRIQNTARAMGYRTVAVFSEADADSPHVQAADMAVCIGGAAPGESYLNIPAIIEAALQTGAEAVHPGYGFLAENAEFAEACVQAGLVFVGPQPQAIRLMGNKRAARQMMEQSGVPCVPGFEADRPDDEQLIAAAKTIGFPIMVKAASGGGGRGMRLVNDEGELQEAITTARSEAVSAFGDDELILERAIINPRHIEIQILADAHGNIIHLGERDCSVQRRHQKVIEEAPSPAVSDGLRSEMGRAAVAAARSVDYVGAGTVELLLDGDSFYFLEMNTRLQVEHAVTEMVTGLDLVELQFKIAAGEPLPLGQEDVFMNGHAIEARLYAEDPLAGFLPQTGTLSSWSESAGDGVRIDHALVTGQRIQPFYDPMLAKFVAWGENREQARRRLRRALEDTVCLGFPHNRDFLRKALGNETFVAGAADTGFIGGPFKVEQELMAGASEASLALAACLFHQIQAEQHPAGLQNWNSMSASVYPWLLGVGDEVERVGLRADGHCTFTAFFDGDSHEIELLQTNDMRLRFRFDRFLLDSAHMMGDGFIDIQLPGETVRIKDLTLAPPDSETEQGLGLLKAVMDGRIVSLKVATGERVTKGQTLVVLEAMKMEHRIESDVDGSVRRLHIEEGQQVSSRSLLIEVEPDPS